MALITLGANSGKGKILQVVQGTSTTTASTTSTSYVDTNCTATITPSSSSSTIIGIATGFALKDSSSNTVEYAIFRNSTDLNDTTGGGNQWGFNGATGSTNTSYIPCTMSFSDSPSTTSATVYKVKMKMAPSGGTAYFYRLQFMTLMEIQG